MKIVTDDEITASKYYNNVTNTLDHITLRTMYGLDSSRKPIMK